MGKNWGRLSLFWLLCAPYALGDVYHFNSSQLPEFNRNSSGAIEAVHLYSNQLLLETHIVPGSPEIEDGVGEVLFSLDALGASNLKTRDWNNQSIVSLDIKPGAKIMERFRSFRARLFLEDEHHYRMYLPNKMLNPSEANADGWITLSGEPTISVPLALGFVEEGFDPQNIVAVGLNIESSNGGSEVYEQVALKNLTVTFQETIQVNPLPIDQDILQQEPVRAEAMNERIQLRLGNSSSRIYRGVNLAWAGYQPSPDSPTLQLYGTFMHAEWSWGNGEYLDLRHPGVRESVRNDFKNIRELFGAKSIVRVFMFPVLASGMEFDSQGNPLRFTSVAEENTATLLQLAQEEDVVLIPVLFDFLIADGKRATYIQDPWKQGERPDLFLEPSKREKLFSAVENYIRKFANHPAVLVWDLINEPENATAACNPRHFREFQTFLKEGVDAIHRAGEKATIGHRNLWEVGSNFRGRIAEDFGQAHFYPYMETRRNPVNLGTPPANAFGVLPAGWGEAPVQAGAVFANYLDARTAGHRYLMFWSWRGDDETGDAFAIRAYADEIKTALNNLERAP